MNIRDEEQLQQYFERQMTGSQEQNFLINVAASAADLEALGEEVRQRVIDMSGVELEWEIRRIGVPARIGDDA